MEKEQLREIKKGFRDAFTGLAQEGYDVSFRQAERARSGWDLNIYFKDDDGNVKGNSIFVSSKADANELERELQSIANEIKGL